MPKCQATILVLALLSVAAPSGAADVTGVVHDATGAVVQAATVIVRPATGPEHQLLTGPDGTFAVDVPVPGSLTIVVRAGGFAELSKTVPEADRPSSIDLVLAPAGILEALTVTAARGAIESDTPAATTVMTAETLRSSPAAMLDDQLKTVPGFSLFRRTSSRVANPTTQGLTMRGLSASGASRGLVLVDGVPLNDAFGGWVYWDRVPQTALDRVEVVRGGTSDLYGADAVGGVIQILTLAPARPSAHASVEYGSRSTPRLSGAGGTARNGWSGFGAAEWQDTDGYILVTPSQQGAVDTPANSEYTTGYGNLAYQTRSWRAGFRVNAFNETRANGTPLTNNDTSSRSASGEVSGAAGNGFWQARGYGGTQDYNQSFSAVAASRATETLTQTQFVPSKNSGAGGQWTMNAGPGMWSFGADTRRVDGTTEQTTYTNNQPTAFAAPGGVQWTSGAFARLSAEAGDTVTLIGSIRADRWSSNPSADGAANHDAVEVSPKGGITWRVRPSTTIHGSASHGFRAPTLNELFRNFRAGNTLTSANDQLEPESLTSAEGGVTFLVGTHAVRAVGFWNHLENAITNVTVSSTPALITRQRRNAGTIRAAGVELEEELKFGSKVALSFSQAFIDSKFVDAVEPGLAGKTVSQVPKASASFGGRYNAPWGITASGQVRGIGEQFDDDLNTLVLGAAGIVDAQVSKTIGRRIQLFWAVENLGDKEYEVGRTPVVTVGLPRTFRGGIRADLP
jgi:outer membrane cobalamin receptor